MTESRSELPAARTPGFTIITWGFESLILCFDQKPALMVTGDPFPEMTTFLEEAAEALVRRDYESYRDLAREAEQRMQGFIFTYFHLQGS